MDKFTLARHERLLLDDVYMNEWRKAYEHIGIYIGMDNGSRRSNHVRKKSISPSPRRKHD